MTDPEADEETPHWADEPRDSAGRWATADPVLGHVIEWDTDTGS